MFLIKLPEMLNYVQLAIRLAPRLKHKFTKHCVCICVGFIFKLKTSKVTSAIAAADILNPAADGHTESSKYGSKTG